MRRRAFAALMLMTGCSCDWRLERMLSQPRVAPYVDDPERLAIMKASSPPAGTVPWNSVVGPPELVDGCSGANYAQDIPIETTDLVTTGRARFTILCATCHGQWGTGDSAVARAMEKAKPRSLIIPPVRAYPPGRVYRTIVFGYKFMPSYRDELDVRERWATIAYLQRLQSENPHSGVGVPGPVRPGPLCPGGAP